MNTPQTPDTASGLDSMLSADEYRLALLGLVDFEGHWDALEAAAGMVVDGPAKTALIREQLLPIADRLPGLLDEGVEVLRLWMARYWFDSQLCQQTARPKRARAGKDAGLTPDSEEPNPSQVDV